ncbi:isochorismatase family protein [Kitasatospora purpeofusca]|uniref:isochorismatase family protein n=1 Tax=Kitasatospora purpeofusca TaxID=67352 RepID=UPI0036C10E9B
MVYDPARMRRRDVFDVITEGGAGTVKINDIPAYALPSPADLPANLAQWEIDPSRAALLVHDMQQYFVRPFPQEMAAELVGNTELVRSRCRQAGVPVAFSLQPGGMSPQERGLLADFWGPGMGTDPRDTSTLERLLPGPEEKTFTKWRYSAFFRNGLLEWMRQTDRDQLIICGVYAHIGVLATAMDAFTNDIQPFVVADATADFSAKHHRAALEYVAERCAVVIDSSEVLS